MNNIRAQHPLRTPAAVEDAATGIEPGTIEPGTIDLGKGLHPGVALGFDLLPRWEEHSGFTLCRSALAVTGAIFVARIAHLPTAAGWAVLLAATFGSVLTAAGGTALAAGAAGWLLGTGFEVNRLGDLTFGPGDRIRLAIIVLDSPAVGLVAAALRRAGARTGTGRRQGSVSDRAGGVTTA